MSEFVASNSNPILSIIKHFKLPHLPAYRVAHLILLEVTNNDDLPAEVDNVGIEVLAYSLFGDRSQAFARMVAALMYYHIEKHRGI